MRARRGCRTFPGTRTARGQDDRRGPVNKSSLVAEVAKRTDRNKADVAKMLDETMDVIRDAVARGERVSLVGFGTFEKRRRNRRVARNPKKPEIVVPVPARDVPSFAPGEAFRQAVATKRRRSTGQGKHVSKKRSAR